MRSRVRPPPPRPSPRRADSVLGARGSIHPMKPAHPEATGTGVDAGAVEAQELKSAAADGVGMSAVQGAGSSVTYIDAGAPVVARVEVEVAAEPRHVWSVLADIDSWPTWNPAVRDARLDGELEVGASFTW